MFTAFFFLSLLLVRSQKKGSFLGNLSSGLQDYFFIQLILGLSFLAPFGYEKFFFSILSLAYFTLVFLDLQISRIYKRGLIWSDFQWFEKSLWSLKDSVFYEIGFRGLGQLFTLLILWGSTPFFALKLFHPLLLLASAGSLWFHTHLFFRFFPKKINKKPPPLPQVLSPLFSFLNRKNRFLSIRSILF